ncbi:cobalt-precorrin-5B (C(1))-methyltransferase CbiD, partial [Desulfovibrio sp. OttesenSCG-928-G15]|nr:cobalt-precorrin-5B (C(1))-methyltransferase CbiD [Desulfovibrio sp. OttesenSCG-928-G15]
MAGQQTALRDGYTTGTCAAAAAKAAAACLLHGLQPSSVNVSLPPFQPSSITVHIPVERTERLGPEIAAACVVKDGGDDPDVTHKARIIVFASPRPFGPTLNNPSRYRENDDTGPLHQLFADCLSHLSAPVYPADNAPMDGGPAIVLYAGTGVGRVTLPGLPVPVGEPAINPVPRRQIAVAARQAARHGTHETAHDTAHKTVRGAENGVPREAGNTGELHLLVCVPDGKALSERTLNARLGIMGGISILGTGGIVKPYSHDAWTCAVSQAISVAAALALPEILFTTGRRS